MVSFIGFENFSQDKGVEIFLNSYNSLQVWNVFSELNWQFNPYNIRDQFHENDLYNGSLIVFLDPLCLALGGINETETGELRLITFVVHILLDVGLRVSCLVCSFLLAAGAGIRCITEDQPWANW